MDPFDLIRAWFAAFNRGDLETLGRLYADDAALEHRGGRAAGRGEVLALWRAVLSEMPEGAGTRRRLRMVGLVDSGVMRAEWVEREGSAGGEGDRHGYSTFRFADGAVAEQYDAWLDGPAPVPDGPPVALPPRRYPPRPVVGVGAVIVHDGRVVLIKRRYEPLAGQWSLPGGTLELGESLESGVAREIAEETGLDVEVGPLVEVFDRILLDAESRVQYHFVLVDYLCRPVGGTLAAGSDVEAAVWAHPSELPSYRLTAKAAAIIARALAMAPGA